MADVNNPESPSEAVKTTSPPNVNGAVPPHTPTTAGGEPNASETSSAMHVIVMQLRGLAGLAVVLLCGWGGLIAGALYLTRATDLTLVYSVLVAAGVSLALFLALESKHLLTGLMGLRPFHADTYGIKSALFLWATGVPGLMFRSAATADLAEAEAEGATRPAQKQEPQQADGVREIIETIVFVVVLVLLLKSFAAEAFVIPTGSMAETLYGYQRIITCPQCGREFPVNCSSEVDPSQGAKAEPITGCTCPGCRYHIDFAEEEKKDPNWKKSDWNSGDRVLVAKFLYELFNKRPNRLDVVVFKYPGDSGHKRLAALSAAPGPIRNQTPMNYIKRLIGLPGETIAIHRGKLYVLPPGSGIEYDDWQRAQTNEDLRIRLWQWEFMHVNDERARRRLGNCSIRRNSRSSASRRRP